MTDNTNQNSDNQGTPASTPKVIPQPDVKPETKTGSNELVDVDALVSQKVEEQLKDIKSKLDSAYAKRDEALQKAAEFEKKERDREIERLKEEGKMKEAYELQLEQERSARAALEAQNVSLTRDVEVKDALAQYDFRNPTARQMASKLISEQLVKNESGQWVHKTGVSIGDFVKLFVEAEENSFLLKPKVSSGSGSSGPSTASTTSTTGKSLLEMPTSEILKLAAAGKLPHQQRQ